MLSFPGLISRILSTRLSSLKFLLVTNPKQKVLFLWRNEYLVSLSNYFFFEVALSTLLIGYNRRLFLEPNPVTRIENAASNTASRIRKNTSRTELLIVHLLLSITRKYTIINANLKLINAKVHSFYSIYIHERRYATICIGGHSIDRIFFLRIWNFIMLTVY